MFGYRCSIEIWITNHNSIPRGTSLRDIFGCKWFMRQLLRLSKAATWTDVKFPWNLTWTQQIKLEIANRFMWIEFQMNEIEIDYDCGRLLLLFPWTSTMRIECTFNCFAENPLKIYISMGKRVPSIYDTLVASDIWSIFFWVVFFFLFLTQKSA